MNRLLIVGLGNPGGEYAKNRHNVGFMFLDALAGDGAWKKARSSGSLWSPWKLADDATECFLLKPQSYMNLSGNEVREFSNYHKIPAADILVCYDDFALPFPRLRMRLKGSSGGHNGMDSIIEQMGTQEIPRIRVGIGPVPPRQDPKNFVLGNFSKDQLRQLEKDVFPKLLDGIRSILSLGAERAMNLVNAPEKSEETKP